MARLTNKTVIITGAAGGIGKAAVEIFSREGSRVLACDMVEGRRDDIFPGLEKDGDEVVYVAADLTKEDQVAMVVDSCISHYGRVDVLFNNHGVMVGKPFLETTEADFDYLLNGNLKSVFFLSQCAAKQMAGSGGGSIIINASVGGLVGFFNMAAYGASKGGAAQLARLMATDLAPYNIRVNAICPGVIDTPQPRQFMKDVEDKEALWKKFADMHVLKRVGRPEEVVWLAVFLASDESSFMTGAVIPIDGGLTAI